MIRRRFILTTIILSVWFGGTPAGAAGPNLLPNGGFEDASFDPDTPNGWTRQAFAPGASLTWETETVRDGLRSARIGSPTLNDAAWTQTVALEPDRNYLLSGWIKTENVAHGTGGVDAGANLCLWGSLLRTPALTGTNDWTYVRMTFNSGPTGIVTICARIGYWSGVTTGTAWFDDLQVREIVATDPHPRWKILVLIYDSTDVTLTDATGTRHVIGHVEPAQLETAAANAARFVNNDIPALSSGNMVPELTVRYPGTLRRLTELGGGWWPSPADTAGERDPSFDSVIVIWQPTVTDQATGRVVWIGNAAGLASWMGTAQTYATLIIEAATLYGHLNVFKHEWGHSLLFYFDATGTAPRPTVNNHTEATTYVHCMTGVFYDWVDETDANPIPNSIYNNGSGFTHDYYSGTTALATDPLHCLGITPGAWALGGPVTMPGALGPSTPSEKIQAIRTRLQQLVDTGTLPRPWSRALEAHLDAAVTALVIDDIPHATGMIDLFRKKVLLLRRQGRLSAAAADELVALADATAEILELPSGGS